MTIRNLETRARIKARIERLESLREHAREMIEIRRTENDAKAEHYYVGRSGAYTVALGMLEELL